MENVKLSEGAISSKKFFDDVDIHFKMYAENKDYRDRTHHFEKGKKLYLEVEVVDQDMTFSLLKWLYGTDENKSKHIPFGLKLNVINFNNPTNEEIKRKLLEIIETL